MNPSERICALSALTVDLQIGTSSKEGFTVLSLDRSLEKERSIDAAAAVLYSGME
jgi:hypothetical protein